MRKKLLVTAVALGSGLACGLANAAVFNLCAGTTTVIMPDSPTPITMWGYALDNDANLANGCGGAIQSPGPILTVAHDDPDPNVTINLLNNLPVGTSLVIPGQSAAMTPVYTTDAQGRNRVTSLTHVTAPGTIGTYQWSNFKPGSHSYHSGTHLAVQVQMGLFGGVKKDAALGTAYTGVPYDQEAIIFYSEIDRTLHDAVANGTYGTTGPTSTINYQPQYFLVNGAPYTQAGSTPIPTAGAGQRTLLRFFNMGLRTVAPTVLGQYVKVVAEDGRAYPYAREQYSLMMAAGKTHDAIFVPAQDGSYPIYDRLLNLSSGAMAPGGLYAFLQVGAAAPTAPVANADSYSVAEDTPLSIAAPGVLGNDIQVGGTLLAVLTTAASGGSVSLASDGSFNFTPAANFNGTAQFSYQASDGVNMSVPATVAINVTPVNDAPVAVNDVYETTMDTPLTVANPGVLANDTDAEGSALYVRLVQVTQPANGTLTMNWNGKFTYTPNPGFTGVDSFTYKARDDQQANSNAGVVTINVKSVATNQAPVANADYATTTMNTAVSIPILANDSDADGTLDRTSVVLTSMPANSANKVWVNPTYGGIRFTPAAGFRGSETFSYTVRDNLGAVSNSATVRVDVTN